MKKFLLISLLFALPAFARADEDAPSCSQITDQFCTKLWSKEYKGNQDVFDGRILQGTSTKSQMAMVKILDLKALIDSLPRLPADLKEKAAPVLAELTASLANERDEEIWYNEVSLISQKFDNVVSEVANIRFLAAYPEMKGVKYDDFKTEQGANYTAVSNKLADSIVDAKYANHENWKRVQAVYPLVQAALEAEIQKLNINQDRKDFMLKQISGTELSLPYKDPAKGSSPKECATTEVNAFYQGNVHRFVVCAGYFNAMQSAPNLFATMAHEIGHALDSNAQNIYDVRKNSPISAALKKLVNAKGPVYACDEWKKLTSEVLVPQKEITMRNINPFDNLYACLQSRKDLKEFTTEAVRYAANYSAGNTISDYSGYHSFIYIAQPTFDKYGKTEINDSYMRPDFERARLFGFFDPGWDRDAEVTEIFTQSLACQKVAANGRDPAFASASEAEKPALFEAALLETTSILQAQREDLYSYCGRSCRSLAQFRLSVDPGENTADWFSYKALAHYLNSLDKANRAEASAIYTSDLCDRPDVSNSAPEFAAIEKQFSLESHPNKRIRRISAYIPAAANSIGCKAVESTKGYGLCEL